MSERYLASVVAPAGLVAGSTVHLKRGRRSGHPSVAEQKTAPAAQQLREFQGSGIVSRTVYPDTPPRVVYSIARGSDGGYQTGGVRPRAVGAI